MEFICIQCDNREEHDCKRPEIWHVKRYALDKKYRFVCKECGAFMYPAELYPVSNQDTENLFVMFAFCENAYRCELNDIYRPDCENGHIKPRCLFDIFRGIDDLGRRLDELEKALQVRP